MNYGAFINEEIQLKPLSSGCLNGLKFAVKDVYKIKGYRNTAGNPTWFETHPASEETAKVISLLLEEGASLKGTTITDELMFSLNGENIHYGTPSNPLDSNRIPGGSSSGSAVAVAAGLVDFALGTDTGGSVRLPSSYCGLYGIRPSHNDVPIEQVIPLAPSFDTVGWMARDAKTLKIVGDVLLPKGPTHLFSQILLEKECWSFIDEPLKSELIKVIETIPLKKTYANVSKSGLAEWSNIFKTIQGKEAWEMHGDWISTYKPQFAPAIESRFTNASTVNTADYLTAKHQQEEIINKMDALLNTDKILVVPTTATTAPLKGEKATSVEKTRVQALKINSIAGLAGLPQVTVPIQTSDGLSIGISFISRKHSDRSLLQFISHYLSDASTRFKV